MTTCPESKKNSDAVEQKELEEGGSMQRQTKTKARDEEGIRNLHSQENTKFIVCPTAIEIEHETRTHENIWVVVGDEATTRLTTHMHIHKGGSTIEKYQETRA
ncbi:hypothetical protein BDN70DRAFT_886880 [Pholiota conissans]|uniref:Uncharacterized protein n=1 Tax=Pholiota conissans TaxID=109636 RepID=A0A9P6CMQ1_9AGAR|nr:hypothetical protein BDN70DRAFT_886880 [Pholiota conissans]